MSPQNRLTLGPLMDSRLAAYATLAGVALAAPVVANANVVYSGPVNILIPATTAGVYLNVVTGVNNTSPGAAPGWDFNPFSSTTFSFFAATPNTSSGYICNAAGGASATLVDNLPIGFLISVAQGTWNFNNAVETTGPTAWNLNSNNNYVGFRFLSDSAVVSYGWAQIHLGATLTDPTRAIIGYAYDNAGGGVLAGVVPEPTTFALLGVMAAGAFGVREWRKRKTA